MDLDRMNVILALGLTVLAVNALATVYSSSILASNVEAYLNKLWGLEVSYARYKPYVHPFAAIIANVEIWIPAVELCITNTGGSPVELHIDRVSIYKDGERVAVGREPTSLRLRPWSAECTLASMNTWSVKHFVDEEKRILTPGDYTIVVEGTLIKHEDGYTIRISGVKLKASLRIQGT
jgi:hypothetical protein